jgi:ribosomal protein L7/L12
MSTDSEVLVRIGRLETLVEHLYTHLGIAMPEWGTDVSAEVRELVLQGNTIAAIKLHRELSGKGMAEAKADIDALMS